jgi:hypothetical protein
MTMEIIVFWDLNTYSLARIEIGFEDKGSSFRSVGTLVED